MQYHNSSKWMQRGGFLVPCGNAPIYRKAPQMSECQYIAYAPEQRLRCCIPQEIRVRVSCQQNMQYFFVFFPVDL